MASQRHPRIPEEGGEEGLESEAGQSRGTFGGSRSPSIGTGAVM